VHRADLRDRIALAELPGEYDAIIHLAAKAGVRPSINDPVEYQQVNVEGTQNLLEFARARRIRQFVFGSSSSVYGVSPNVPWTEADSVLQPISPYASSKVSGELLGHVYAHLFGIRFLALRFFTVYGPRQRPDLAIHKFSRRILAGEPIPVYGDGSTRRDYTYVDDIVAGVIAALHYDASEYEVINLGNNHTVSLSELIAALETALGRKADVKRMEEQPGDVRQTWANTEKAGRLLGYHPATRLEDGLRRFAEWLAQADGAPAAPR
jgi:UDP-glucuronate 4-epimerase